MNGVLLIDKPEGLTSFGTLIRVKKIINQKKCGHTGTLDPMATGILTVMLGSGTRFCELLPVHDKAYRASIRLGTVTDTLDITGNVLETNPVASTREDLLAVLQSFTGKIMQVPPMYSAVSVNGRRLYQLARKGEEIERESREIEIYSLVLSDYNDETKEFTVDVSCSAGTYIRSLADDIGRKLGCGAVLTGLRRTSANGFGIEKALTLEALADAVESGTLCEHIMSVDSVLESYPAVYVTAPQGVRFSNGGELLLERLTITPNEGIYRVYAPGRQFIGLGEIKDGCDSLLVKKIYKE